jgi:hypothetical protein
MLASTHFCADSAASLNQRSPRTFERWAVLKRNATFLPARKTGSFVCADAAWSV